jgi:hypothetical protein
MQVPSGSAVRKRCASATSDQALKRPRPFIFQDPENLLLDTSDHTSLYTDLPLSSIPNIEIPMDDSKDDRMVVAVWGERFVKTYLEMQKDAEGSVIRDIQWMGESDNPYTPYDFKLVTEETPGVLREIFIEVKTTTSSQKAFCEISIAELNVAMEMKECFHLYRVFNAGDMKNVKLCKVEDVADKIKKKLIKVCLVV